MTLLEALSESPKSWRELLEVMPREPLDIHLRKLTKERKVLRNAKGQYCLPAPPPTDEPLRLLTTEHKQKISWAKKYKGPSNETHRTCDRCGAWKANSSFPKNGNGYREYRCYPCVAKRHRELRALKGDQR